MNKLTLLFATVLTIMLTGCVNTDLIKETAIEDISKGKYKDAMKTLLQLSDSKLESNDSLMLLLSQAYYGNNKDIEALKSKSLSDFDFTPDRKHILFSDLRGDHVTVYSFPDLQLERKIEVPSNVYALEVSPTGKEFAVALEDSRILIYDFESGKQIKELEGHTSRVRAVAYLDTARLISGSNDQNLVTWDLNTGKEIDRNRPHSRNIKDLHLSNDRKYLVSSSNDGTAIIWTWDDTDHTWYQHRKVSHGDNYVNSSALSPDNKLLATVSGDEDLKIWDATSGTLITDVPLGDAGCSVTFSPDGKTIMVGATTGVFFIDTESEKIVGQYSIPKDAVWEVSFPNNNEFMFIDNARMYRVKLLTGKNLIEAARKRVE